MTNGCSGIKIKCGPSLSSLLNSDVDAVKKLNNEDREPAIKELEYEKI